MIKMLFSDLDGTLLYIPPRLTSGVSPENKAAIRRLQQHHVRFAIATGRSVDFLSRTFDPELVLDTVGMCGASSGSIPTDVGQPLIRVSSITVGGR